MLQSDDKYVGESGGRFDALKKCLFLVALASGNRVSDLAAVERSGILFESNKRRVTLPVKPGFLFKNQRLGRAPPNISFPSLESDPALCPVQSLSKYIRDTETPSGQLFLNSKTARPLHPSTLSRILAELIEEADPGHLPRGHDVRILASSWLDRGACLPHKLYLNCSGPLPPRLSKDIWLQRIM
jgi:hypothetical protein